MFDISVHMRNHKLIIKGEYPSSYFLLS